MTEGDKFWKNPDAPPVHAIRFTGDNLAEISTFLGQAFHSFVMDVETGEVTAIKVNTREGVTRGEVGYYFVKGIEGEFYPCKGEIFLKNHVNYNPAEMIRDLEKIISSLRYGINRLPTFWDELVPYETVLLYNKYFDVKEYEARMRDSDESRPE